MDVRRRFTLDNNNMCIKIGDVVFINWGHKKLYQKVTKVTIEGGRRIIECDGIISYIYDNEFILIMVVICA